jgi:hypothetical protein
VELVRLAGRARMPIFLLIREGIRPLPMYRLDPFNEVGKYAEDRKGGPRGDLGRPLFETAGAVEHRQTTWPSHDSYE